MSTVKVILFIAFFLPLTVAVWVLLYIILEDRRHQRYQRDLERAFEAGFDEGQVAFQAGKMCPPEARGFPKPGRRHHTDNIALEVRAGYLAGWESSACMAAITPEMLSGEDDDRLDIEFMLDDLQRFANGETL